MSKLGQLNIYQAAYLKRSLKQLHLSGISQRSGMVGRVGYSEIIVNLLVTKVARVIDSNAKTLGRIT